MSTTSHASKPSPPVAPGLDDVMNPVQDHQRLTGAGRRASDNQARLGARVPRAVVRAAGASFAKYKSNGIRVSYADNKVGILPDLEGVLREIAGAAGLELADEDTMSRFLEAMVTDVYVNAYSDKQAFDGEIVIGQFVMARRVIQSTLQPKVGTMYRRFARAMAPLVVEVMHDNYDVFGEVLDKRCTELNLSTRAEAVRQFDGADALVVVDRDSARRAAEAKHLALAARPTHRAYTMDGSVASAGLHEM